MLTNDSFFATKRHTSTKKGFEMTDNGDYTTRHEHKFLDGLGGYGHGLTKGVIPIRENILIKYYYAALSRSDWGDIDRIEILECVASVTGVSPIHRQRFREEWRKYKERENG
jgi:hypothetical protein